MEASHSSVVIDLTDDLSLRRMTVLSEVRRSKQPISQHIIEASVAPLGAVRRSKTSREWRTYGDTGQEPMTVSSGRLDRGVALESRNLDKGPTCRDTGVKVPGLTTKNNGLVVVEQTTSRSRGYVMGLPFDSVARRYLC